MTSQLRIPFGESELSGLVDFLRTCPGRITAALVPSREAGNALLQRLEALLRPLNVSVAPSHASPDEIGSQALQRSEEDCLWIVKLDGSRHFVDETGERTFWESLNFQRENLASGRLRTLLVLNDRADRMFAAHADDLREWTRVYRFPDSVPPRDGIETEKMNTPRLSWRTDPEQAPIEVLQNQLRRATEAGFPRDQLTRQYAIPLFEAFLEKGLARNARDLWEQGLYRGRCIDDLEANGRWKLYRSRIRLAQLEANPTDGKTWAKRYIDETAPSDDVNEKGEALFVAGTAFDSLGLFDEAKKAFDSAILLLREYLNKEGRKELERNLAAAFISRGTLFYNQGHLENAISDYGQALEFYKQSVEREGCFELRNELAVVYSNRGNAFSDQGLLVKALSDYDEAIKIIEQMAQEQGSQNLLKYLASVLNNRGLLYVMQGRFAEGKSDLVRSIEIIEPGVDEQEGHELRRNLAMAYVNLGILSRKQGFLEESVSMFDRAIELYTDLFEREGRRELAGNLATNLFSRAVALGQQGKWQNSREDSRRAIGLLHKTIQSGHIHRIPNFLKMLVFCCDNLGQLDIFDYLPSVLNDALAWTATELDHDRLTPQLSEGLGQFLRSLTPHRRQLQEHGLDAQLLDAVQKKFSHLEEAK